MWGGGRIMYDNVVDDNVVDVDVDVDVDADVDVDVDVDDNVGVDAINAIG